MKTLLLSTAVAALVALPLSAQTTWTEGTTDPAAGTEVAPEAGAPLEGVVAADGTTAADPDAAPTMLAAGVPHTDLDGARIYDANDEWIGEVGQVVVTADGKAWAVVDVGGFLGIGEKPVALALDELTVVEVVAAPDAAAGVDADGDGNVDIAAGAGTDSDGDGVADTAPADADGDGSTEMVEGVDADGDGIADPPVDAGPTLRIKVTMTREQLEALPTWEG